MKHVKGVVIDIGFGICFWFSFIDSLIFLSLLIFGPMLTGCHLHMHVAEKHHHEHRSFNAHGPTKNGASYELTEPTGPPGSDPSGQAQTLIETVLNGSQ